MTMKQITEKTLIPVSLVITLIGGTAWVTRLDAKVSELQSKQSEEIEDKKIFQKYVTEILVKVTRIEAKTETIEKRLNN